MSITSDTADAVRNSRRRPDGHVGRRSSSRRAGSRGAARPLHEVLAVGLGCTATGYRLSALPEWR